MLDEIKSNTLWQILEDRASTSRLHFFTTRVQDAGIRVETFSVWSRLNSGRREKTRDHYRMIRDVTGRVLYDQLEDVSSSFVERMCEDKLLVPDIRISPSRSNKLLSAVLEEQAEVDRLIAQNGG